MLRKLREYSFYFGVGKEDEASGTAEEEPKVTEDYASSQDAMTTSTGVNISKPVTGDVNPSMAISTDVNPFISVDDNTPSIATDSVPSRPSFTNIDASCPVSVDVTLLQTLSNTADIMSVGKQEPKSVAADDTEGRDLGIVLEENNQDPSSCDKSRSRNSLSTDSGVASESKDDKVQNDLKKGMTRRSPDTHLIFSIIMSFLTPIVGIPAIYMSFRCRESIRQQSIEKAWYYSNCALLLNTFGLWIIGAIIIACYSLALAGYDSQGPVTTTASPKVSSKIVVAEGHKKPLLPYLLRLRSIYDIDYDMFNRYL